MRAALTIAGLALAFGGLTGCGGSDDGGGSSAPADASKDDFCEAFNGLFETVMAQATEADTSAMVKAIKEWAADVEDVGTPNDMPDDARHGFELLVQQAKDIDDDATLEDFENLGKDLSADDEKDGKAFTDWATANCPLDLPGLPGGSDLPSIDPSDLPSIDPSDLPTDPSELESLMSELTASAGS
jgi:hypothetical protein